ncbi:MAG: hypothetical protein QM804_16310 [Propionicimonas sp.]
MPLPLFADHRRGWLTAAIGVVVLALASWLVVGSGALAPREDGILLRQPGEELDAGNLVFTLDHATLQQVLASYADPEWELLVTGTVRNPHDRTLEPLRDDTGNFFATFDRTTLIPIHRVWPFAIGGSTARPYVLPDNQAVEFTVRFEVADDFTPPDDRSLIVAVLPMEFTDNRVYSLGGGTPVWNRDSAAPFFAVDLDVELLPPVKR